MEILDFRYRLFHEIPTQDNPAFFEEHPLCLMVTRRFKHHSVSPGFSVLGIWIPTTLDRGATSLGHFYGVDNALIFAKAYAEKYKDLEINAWDLACKDGRQYGSN